jgi:FMN phosphatase YigB (HAD superfamily)
MTLGRGTYTKGIVQPIMKVQCIAFDVVGVLIREEKIVSRVLFGMLAEPKRITKEDLKKLYEDGLRMGKMSDAEFWSRFAEGDWHDTESRYLEGLTVDYSAAEVFLQLSSHYKLAIVSDMPARWGRYVLNKIGCSSHVSVSIFSDEHRAEKEGGMPFRILRDELDIPFGSIIYVDDRKRNLRVADELGIVTVWYESRQDDDPFRPKGVARNLQEVVRFVDALDNGQM